MIEKNKEAAVAFLQLCATGKVREAYEKYAAEDFKHHNPYFEGSADSLKAGMEESAHQNPHNTLEVKRVIAEGDLVAVHSHGWHKPGDPGYAVVHILRFENDRIVEFWDVAQMVPEETPNQHGMF